jgi:hypothetical protein
MALEVLEAMSGRYGRGFSNLWRGCLGSIGMLGRVLSIGRIRGKRMDGSRRPIRHKKESEDQLLTLALRRFFGSFWEYES